MKAFDLLEAVAAPFDSPNVDTDQIAPARFLRKPREGGYGQFLFHDLRFGMDGQKKPGFILNQPAFSEAGILVVNRNFGGGSSREQAVWCLIDYGIRCVIGSTFGDIFFNNAINQGLLLIRETEETCSAIRAQLQANPGAMMAVDLQSQVYRDPRGDSHSFEIEASRKKRLMLGLDEIGLTMQYESRIDAFETAYRGRYPWLFNPSGPTSNSASISSGTPA